MPAFMLGPATFRFSGEGDCPEYLFQRDRCANRSGIVNTRRLVVYSGIELGEAFRHGCMFVCEASGDTTPPGGVCGRQYQQKSVDISRIIHVR